jgi:hypothetical protein
MELNHHEIVSSLFAGSKKNVRIDVLAALILDLFMEVEALREAVIKIDERTFDPPIGEYFEVNYQSSVLSFGKSSYQRAYLNAAFETHNNGGPSGGLDKLLARFYPSAVDDGGRTWRECLLLERLGFSPVEIEEYKSAAEDAEMRC